MPDWIELVTNAFETRFGGWQQPDSLDPCRAGFGSCRVKWDSPYELRKLTAKWSRAVGLTPTQDAGMCTFHFLNLTGDVPDATWTTTDYTTVETAFETYWTGIKTAFPPSTKLAEFVWRADGPAFKPKGSSLSPTLRIQTASLTVGTGSGEQCPPQCAVSVTEVIPSTYVVEDVEGVGAQTRNRWGRFYLPALTSTALVNGRWDATTIENIATRTQTFYNAMVTADLIPVVYSPTTGSCWSMTEIHVDDIIDVIRSRRFETALARHAKTITAP